MHAPQIPVTKIPAKKKFERQTPSRFSVLLRLREVPQREKKVATLKRMGLVKFINLGR